MEVYTTTEVTYKASNINAILTHQNVENYIPMD